MHRPHPATEAKKIFLADQATNQKQKAASLVVVGTSVIRSRKTVSDSSLLNQEKVSGSNTFPRNPSEAAARSSADTRGSSSNARSVMRRTLRNTGTGQRMAADGAKIPVQLFNVTNAFYGEFLKELSQGTYSALVTTSFNSCLQNLPWWQGYQSADAVPIRTNIAPSNSRSRYG